MLDFTRKYIEKHQLLTPNKKVIVAVSGGEDSMVLLHALKSLHFKVIVAHCNFNLRAKESIDDEHFVQSYCKEYEIPFHVRHFKKSEIKDAKSESTQMAARRLRYAWFIELATTHDCPIAIAHHLNDQIETFFINLSRGTGFNGITGISNKNGHIIRPMLNWTKDDIQNYRNEHNIPFRLDSSNNSDDYLRNKIRHHLSPKLSEVFEHFDKRMLSNFERWHDDLTILNGQLNTSKEKAQSTDNSNKFSIDELLKLDPLPTYLFHWFKQYGFNIDQCQSVSIGIKKAESGKKFLTESHRLLIDRNFLILSENINDQLEYHILENDQALEIPIALKISKHINNNKFKLDPSEAVLQIDAQRIDFPLKLRKWKQGDRLIPLGMNHAQKISDYFSDHKFSLIEKEQTWLLESSEEIVWILGYRMSEKFKITPATREIVEIALL